MATYNLGRVVGPQGETGNGIASTTLNQDYTLTINYTNGDSDTTSSIRGEKGETGATGKDGKDYVITQADYQAIANVVESEITVPTKTSQLTNDSGFITNAVNDLTNYYLKSNTYTKDEVNTLIGNIETISMTVVSELPSEGESNIIYLVPSSDPQTQNVKDEYIWVNNSWEQIGSTAIDLSDYQTKIDSTHKLDADLVDDTSSTNKFVTASDKATWNAKSDFSGDYNDLTNKPTIPTVPTNVSAFTNDAGYTTNTGTITSVKMNGNTVSSSGEADLGTVITSHQDISGKEDKTNKVTSMSASSTDTQYPSAKCVYDAISGVGNLSYKGHVSSTGDLPSIGQPSATVEEPNFTFSTDFTPISDNTTGADGVKSHISETYPYVIGSYTKSSSNYYTYCIRTDDYTLIDGVTYVKASSTSSTKKYIAFHITYNPNKHTQIFATVNSQYIVGNSETLSIPGNGYYTVTQSGWISFGLVGSSTYQVGLFSNFPDPIKFIEYDFTKIKIGSENFVSINQVNTLTNPSNYTYALNYQFLKFDTTTCFASFVGAEPSSGAVENAVYTVGSNYDIYRCSSTPTWELWSATDTTGLEVTSNKVTSLSSSSTDTQYPSAKCVYDIIGDIESLLSEV